MGLWKTLGRGLGRKVRELGDDTARVIHHATGSRWARDVVSGAGLATERNAQQAGDLADGLADAAAGVVGADRERRRQGVRSATGVVKEAVTQIAHGAAITAGVAADVAVGAVRGDGQRAIDSAKQLGTIVAVSALAVGVVDGVFDGIGLIDEADIATGRHEGERGADDELHPELREIDERR